MEEQRTGLQILAGLSPESREELAKGLTRHRFRKGQQILEKGQPVSGAYLVEHGQLRVYTLTPSGKEATLYVIDSGETCILALNSLFSDLLYPAWVEAALDAEVSVVPGRTFRTLFSNEKPIQNLVITALSTVVLRLMAELEQVHANRIDQRLASFLLNNADSKGTVRMTQQEIAGHIGTTREVIGRLMVHFSASGMIETGRGQLHLRDTLALGSLIRREENQNKV